MRLMLQEDLPLNEGLMEPLEINLPTSLLNPTFTGDAALDPAVVGGPFLRSRKGWSIPSSRL